MFETLEMRQCLSAATPACTPILTGSGPDASPQEGMSNRPASPAASRPGSGVATAALSATEAADLVAIARDEKLARDVYSALYAKWGSVVFKNIMASEQQHLTTVSKLMTKYKVTNPVAALPAGVFDTVAAQSLYNQLVATGSQSLAAALRVGVQIEELDINDLKTTIQHTTHADIRNVYTNLLEGSQNHLAAFKSQLSLLPTPN